MAYLFTIDDEDRVIDFAIYSIPLEKSRKKRVTKLTMIREFIKHNKPAFFTIDDIAKLLKLNRKTIERFLVTGELRTYKINYFFAPNGTLKKEEWEKQNDSNLKMVVHQKDLRALLFNIIKSSHIRLRANTVEAGIDDHFNRNGEIIENKPFVCFLEHERTQEQIQGLIDDIVIGTVQLHSKLTLQQLINKSDTSFTRMMKCAETVRLNFGGERDTTRVVFRDENIKNVKDSALTLIRIISTNQVVILPIQLPAPEYLIDKEFKDPVDYVSLYKEGYREPPQGIFQTDNMCYFAVEREAAGNKGIEIKRYLNMLEEIAAAMEPVVKASKLLKGR
ncbi:hypothetical protein AB1284_25745 [Bacillus sp. S2(2024)]|uniref:hypothetical protein n=1 Tax=Bacillus sp. S2(2024) TaxID=3162887 RepID=UPI003D1DEEA5